MSLIDEINAKSKEVSTDKYSMSIGEIISMYSEGDLDFIQNSNDSIDGLYLKKQD